MCRMALAIGEFDTVAVAKAVQDMAEGVHARHCHTVRRHPDGWGALWEVPGAAGRLRQWRDCGPLGEADLDAIFAGLSTRLFAIHARHASDPVNLGLRFTHPVARGDALIMHNGYAPNVAAALGLPRSTFDTAELLDYLLSDGGAAPSPAQVTARLRMLGSGMTAANCFLVTGTSILIVNWFDEGLGLADFYTLWALALPRTRIIASEILPSLGAAEKWRPLGHGKVLRLKR